MLRTGTSAFALAVLCAVAASTAQAGQFKTLYTYPGGSKAGPSSTLTLDRVGNLYGMTTGAGDNSSGAFNLSQSGTKKALSNYLALDPGPLTQSLPRDTQGNLFGILYDLNDAQGAIFEISANGQTSILHKFYLGLEGNNPSSGLLADKAGNFYGTTSYNRDFGTPAALYRFAPDGTINVLHTFNEDEGQPSGEIIADKDGNLYGGTKIQSGYQSVVYKIAPDGTETILHTFNIQDGDVEDPAGGLVFDKKGNLYGMSKGGGVYGYGTAFRIAPDGSYTILHSFGGPGDGIKPIGALVADADGMFYGATAVGGPMSGGTVFQMSPDGKEKILHAFSMRGKKSKRGSWLISGLTIDPAGNLYGATASWSDAKTSVAGTIFEIEK